MVYVYMLGCVCLFMLGYWCAYVCVHVGVCIFVCVRARLKGAPFVAEHATDTNSPFVDQLMLNKNQQEL